MSAEDKEPEWGPVRSVAEFLRELEAGNLEAEKRGEIVDELLRQAADKGWTIQQALEAAAAELGEHHNPFDIIHEVERDCAELQPQSDFASAMTYISFRTALSNIATTLLLCKELTAADRRRVIAGLYFGAEYGKAKTIWKLSQSKLLSRDTKLRGQRAYAGSVSAKRRSDAAERHQRKAVEQYLRARKADANIDTNEFAEIYGLEGRDAALAPSGHPLPNGKGSYYTAETLRKHLPAWVKRFGAA